MCVFFISMYIRKNPSLSLCHNPVRHPPFSAEHHIPTHKKRKIKDYRHENWIEEIKWLIHFIIELYERIDSLTAFFDHKDIEAYLPLCRKPPPSSKEE